MEPSAPTLKARISEILADADLDKISTKIVRKQLEQEYNVDLTSRKGEIKEIVMEVLDNLESNEPETREQSVEVNGSGDKVDYDRMSPAISNSLNCNSGEVREKSKPHNSIKKESTPVDDHALALQIHMQENSGRRRQKRMVGVEKPIKIRKKPKSSEFVDGEGTPKKKRGGGGLNKPLLCSEALYNVVGERELSRPQVVKQLWAYIKARDLQDPSDRRFILCGQDEKLKNLFEGKEKVNAFSMNKHLSKHLKAKEDVINPN